MARRIELHKTAESGRLNISSAGLTSLVEFLDIGLRDALSARKALEYSWRKCIQDYEGVPEEEYTRFPVIGFKNIVLTLGALTSDIVYAQAKDLLTATTPLVTVRAIPKQKGDKVATASAKALQRFCNWGAECEWGTYEAMDNMILDDVYYGTAALYTLWRERIRKNHVAKKLSFGPWTEAIPIEDFIVPPASAVSMNDLRWCSVRKWFTLAELNDRANRNKWQNVGLAQPCAARDMITQVRQSIGRQIEGVFIKGKLYDIHAVYCLHDIDEDGIAEDLLAIWNHAGRQLLAVTFNPYDSWPVDVCRYQKRPHLFYGMGVLEMARPYQDEVSRIHNNRNLNMLLANARLWKGRRGSVPETMTVWGGKVVTLANPDDLQGEALADVYPSIFQAQMLDMQLLERRVGVNEMSSPRPSQVMGSRTPGVTALTLMQQANKRFVPAFSGMRDCISGSIRQCLTRYQEQVLRGNNDAKTHILDVLGNEDGLLVVELLGDPKFDEFARVELTASSSVVNREADKQNAMLLVSILWQYYDRVMQLATIATNPQVTPPIKEVATKIAHGASEILDRTIRTFDQVRDPGQFIVELADTLDAIAVEKPGLEGLLGMLGEGGGSIPGIGAAPLPIGEQPAGLGEGQPLGLPTPGEEMK